MQERGRTGDARVRFTIPAEFVARQGLPTATELSHGYRYGWIRREDVVAIALTKYEAGLVSQDAEEALALLLTDEFDRVDDLTEELANGDQPETQRARYWLVLALAWLRVHPELVADPLATIELLYADFDYPAEIEGLVRYLPVSPGSRTGADAIDRRWAEFVDVAIAAYLQRQRRGMA